MSDDYNPFIGEVSQSPITLEYCLEAGANGVDIPNEVYHSLGGISGSGLAYLAESNRHYDNRQLFNDEDSAALQFGSLFHCLVLEPDQFKSRYVVSPKFDLRSNAGKAEKKAFIDNSSGLTVISPDDFDQSHRMARNVLAICGDIVDQGIKERSLFADIDGLVCKCRLDIDHESVGDDYDLKSIGLGTKDFSDRTLESHIKKFGYHRSAAFRNMVRRELGKPVRDSYLIFCNTGSGNMVRVIKMAQDWILEAQDEVDYLLSLRRIYLRNGKDKGITEIDDSQRNYNRY